MIRRHQTRWEKTLPGGGARYYEIRIEQDLWGALILTQVWGGRGKASGQVRHTPVANEGELAEVLLRVVKRRVARRYSYVSGTPASVAVAAFPLRTPRFAT